MIDYILSCTAWSLGGMLFGYLLAKVELERATREQNDDTRAPAPSPAD